MNASTVLLLLTLYMGAARGAPDGGCGRAGALRCDSDGRHLSACTQGGAWRRVLDCGASHGACVDSRCVGGASVRAEQCTTPGEWGCSSDCVYTTICTTNNVWVEVSKCPAGYLCDNGQCVDSTSSYCRYSNIPICGKGSGNQIFPNMEDCTGILFCDTVGNSALHIPACTTDPNIYYNPCIRSCDSSSTICERYQNCNGNEGLDAVIPGNPTLHYICANGTMFLMKCESASSYYDPKFGDCLEIGSQICL